MSPGFAAVLIPFLILLPGYALLPEGCARRLRFPFVIFAGVAVTSVLGIGLMLIGQFTVLTLVLLEIPLLAIRLRSKTWPRLHLVRHLPLLIVFALAAAFAILTSGEPFDATGDAGVYTISAGHLAETGSWSWPLDQVIPEGVPEDLVVYEPRLVRPWREIAPGFVVRGQEVVPQFLPLYAIWGAIFSSWLGIHGALAANILGALLMLLGFDALFRLLLGAGWRWAALAAIILNPVFLIFLKYPSAEVFLSGILAGWLFWMVLFLRKPSIERAAMPAVLLALAMLVKFFAWAVAGTAAMALVLLPARQMKTAVIFVASIAPAILIAVRLAEPHLANHLGQLMILFGFKAFGLGCAAIAIARLAWTRWPRWSPLVLAAGYAGALTWLWFSKGTGIVHDYATLSGLATVPAAAIGLGFYLWRRRHLWWVFPALVFVLLSLFLFIGSGDSPFYPFAARRFLPLTIPLAGLFAAFMLREGKRLFDMRIPLHRWSVVAGSGILVAAAIIPPLWIQRHAVSIRRGSGFLSTLAELDEKTGEGKIVLATGQAWRYGPHLLLGGKPVFCLDLQRIGVLEPVGRLIEHHPDTAVLTSDTTGPSAVEVIEANRADIHPTTSPPLGASIRTGTIFRLIDVSPQSLGSGGVLDIGGDDHLRLTGFWGSERADGRSFRWTGGHAQIMIGSASRIRFIWSSDGNPSKPLVVAVVARGVVVGYSNLTGGWQTSHWFPVPEGEGPALIEIYTTTFQPAVVSGGNDRRTLGLRLDLVETR